MFLKASLACAPIDTKLNKYKLVYVISSEGRSCRRLAWSKRAPGKMPAPLCTLF
jgi:hypothetical protein